MNTYIKQLLIVTSVIGGAGSVEASVWSTIGDCALKFKLFKNAPLFSLRGQIAQQSNAFKATEGKFKLVPKEIIGKDAFMPALQLKDTQILNQRLKAAVGSYRLADSSYSSTHSRHLFSSSYYKQTTGRDLIRDYYLIAEPQESAKLVLEAVKAEKLLRDFLGVRCG